MSIAVHFKGIDKSETAGLVSLDPEQVYIQYLCTTDDATGAHDPNGTPAPRVRPGHAALHGTVWRIDDIRAPIPPCDYGCRCAIRYVSKPKSQAQKVLPPAPSTPVTDPAQPVREWLNDHVDDWKAVAKAAGPRGDIAAAVREARKLGIPMARTIAELVIAAMTKKTPPPEPAP